MTRAIVACGAMLAAACSAAFASVHTAIADCEGKAQQAPRALTLFCGDGNDGLTGLHWSDWGDATASASGTDEVNACNPNCATGHDHGYHVLVTAGQIERAGDTARYRLLTVTFTSSRPKGMARVQRFDLTARGPVVQ